MKLPVFPIETRSRLSVQSLDKRGSGHWGEPRPAEVEDLILALRELSPEQQVEIAGAMGFVPANATVQLKRAEWVFDALADAQQAIDRFRAYRKEFPEKRPEGEAKDDDMF